MRTIVLDGKKMRSRKETHEYLAARFEFPEYYGKNLDALYDCLCEIGEQTTVVFYRLEKMKKEQETYAQSLISTFEDATENNKNLTLLFDKED